MDPYNHSTPFSTKLPILDTGKFEQWKFRIQQYLQHEHYALWKVIEFGDSYKAPPEETAKDKGPTCEVSSSTKKKGRNVAITAEDMQKRKNDVKARTTLLLALPDEHQLRFSKYDSAKELWEAILKIFGGNEATKKTKKNQLKQQYGNFKAEGSEILEQTFNRLQAIVSHLKFIDVPIEQDDLNQKFLTSLALEWLVYTVVWRNRDDLDTMSLDDVYNHLKVYEPYVQKRAGSNSQNMAFISSSNTSSGKSKVPTVQGAFTATTKPNRSQIKYEDVSQIDDDDIEEMNIKWNLALLSMRADRSSRSQDRGKRESYKKDPKVEEHAPKAMIAIDGIRWDRSYMAEEDEASKNHALVVDEEEVPTEYALMAKSSSSSDNEVCDDSFCSKSCRKNTKNLNTKISKLNEELSDCETDLYNYKRDIDRLLGSQKLDKDMKVVGFNEYCVVPPPPSQVYSPPKKDLSWMGLPEFVDDTVTDYTRPTPRGSSGNVVPNPMIEFAKESGGPNATKVNNVENARKPTVKYAEMYRNTSQSPRVRGNQRNWNNQKSQQLGKNFIMQNKACYNCGSFDHLEFNCNHNTWVDKGKTWTRVNHAQDNMKYTSTHKSMTPRAVLLKSGTKPINRPFSTARPTLKSAQPKMTYFVKTTHSNVKRPFKRKSAAKNKVWSPTVRPNISSVGLKVPTAKPAVTADKGNKGKAVKASARWIWKPKQTSSGQGYGDSGCSRHMTGNISYLYEYEPFNGGYVSFGHGRGKITGKGLIKSDFKLVDDKHVLLRTPRQQNMYTIDLKNVVPHKNLTCLIAKAPVDESMLWHRRLGHLNFKTMNKLVRSNLVKGLPSKSFKNDHSCVACLKGKQHKNGVAERRNKTLIEAARTMLVDAKLPVTFWAEAVNTACKFDSKGDEGYFVGYSLSSKAFRVFNKRTNKIEENLHVDFLENKSIEKETGPDWLFDIDTLTNSMNYVPVVVAGTSSTNISGTKEDVHQAASKKDDAIPDNNSPQKEQQEVNGDKEVPESSRNSNLIASSKVFNTDPFELASSSTVETEVPTVSSHVSPDSLTVPPTTSSVPRIISRGGSSFSEPLSLGNAMSFENRLEDFFGDTSNAVSLNEVEANLSNMETAIQFKIQNVWVLVDCPNGVRPIGTKWVLKNKKDERGIVIRNKARLVAQGHTQEEGINYKEVFAPVARIKAIRLFLAYASYMGFTVYQMDVKNAFLYGTIDEEVYVMQPPGFQDHEFPHIVYKMEKAMYGLHQACYGTLSKYLLDNGFQRGLQVLQKKDGIFLSQDKYVGDILKKFGYTEKDGTGKDVELHLYRSMIGSLMYFTASRPDIMFDVYACARHQVTPKECHLHDVKRIFRHLKVNLKLGLWYPKESPFDFVAYLDSDYGGANQDQKSTTRGFQFWGRMLISWQCKKQTIVATSTTEAEYVAAASGCGQVLWIQNQLLDHGTVELFATMLVPQGEGSEHPSEPHYTPSAQDDTIHHEQITQSPQYAQITSPKPIPQSHEQTTSQEPTIPSQSHSDRENIAKTSAMPHEALPRVTSLGSGEGRSRILRIMRREKKDLLRMMLQTQRGMDQGDDLLDRDKSANKKSDSTDEMSHVLRSLGAVDILASGGLRSAFTTASLSVVTASTGISLAVATVSGSFPTAVIFTTVSVATPTTRVTRSLKRVVIGSSSPISVNISSISKKDKGKGKMTEPEQPSKEKVLEQMSIQLARDLKAKFSQEYKIIREQAERDSEIAKIHAKRELEMMIVELDKSNEMIAKYLSDYEQAAVGLSHDEKVELINELRMYQRHLAQIKKYQAQQNKPTTKTERRNFYMSILRSNAGWKAKDFKGMTFEQIEEKVIPSLVKETCNTTEVIDEKAKELWVELKRLYEPDSRDPLWALQSRPNMLVLPHSLDIRLCLQSTRPNPGPPQPISVKDFMTRRVLLRCDSTWDLYPVTDPSLIPHAFLVSQHTWHQCLGHPGREVLRRLVSYNFISCNKEKPLIFCHACQLGKHVMLLFVSSDIVVTACFDIIHSDVWTSPISSLSCFKYYVLFLDQYSQFVWVYPLINKSGVLSKFLLFRTYVRTQFKFEIRSFQCNHGGEFDNRNLHKLFPDNGIQLRFSCLKHLNKMLEGVDVDETFSPVVKSGTIGTVLSLVVSRHWPIHQLDVKNAFLHGDLSKTVYMHQPPEFRDSTYPDHPLLQRIIASLHKEFSMTNLGSLNYFLGIYITRDSFGMFLSKKKYDFEILERAHMVNCNSSQTSVDTESKLGDDGDPVSDPTLYRSLAGSFQYLTFTRPDISYAVQHICLYMHDLREPHLSDLKRILRYIQGTLDYGLQLFSSSTTNLVAYSDADWAGCPTTRRSTSGYCIFFSTDLLSWSSQRQPKLSRFSAETEYRGVANAVAETCWLRNLLRELHTPLSFATLVYCDNVSAVYLSSNSVQHQRTKHIEIDIHFVRNLVAASQVRVLHVLSRYEYADIFTKGLPSALFEEFHTSLSI
nr:ribonuclease H-like domain-containing protein [Tanacetum cinerariifolium]